MPINRDVAILFRNIDKLFAEGVLPKGVRPANDAMFTFRGSKDLMKSTVVDALKAGGKGNPTLKKLYMSQIVSMAGPRSLANARRAAEANMAINTRHLKGLSDTANIAAKQHPLGSVRRLAKMAEVRGEMARNAYRTFWMEQEVARRTARVRSIIKKMKGLPGIAALLLLPALMTMMDDRELQGEIAE